MNKPKPRHDGWTLLRRSRFLARLRAGDSIGRAAALVGMSRESAHRLRRRRGAARFAAAWSRARVATLRDPGAVARARRRRAETFPVAAMRPAAMSTRRLLRFLNRKPLNRNAIGTAKPVPECEAGVTFATSMHAAETPSKREACVTFAAPGDAPQTLPKCEAGVTFAMPAAPARLLNRREFRRARALARRRGA